jgi:hypothetical protein
MAHPPLLQVLPEVMAARARVDDPHAARRKEFERRIKGEAAPATPEELRRYRAASIGVGASGGALIPQVSLSGRNRYNITPMPASTSLAPPRQMSPQEIEVARRSFLAGMRSLAYGSLLVAGLLLAGGSFAARSFGAGPPGEFHAQVKETLEPASRRLKTLVSPLKAKAEGWLRPSDGGRGGAGQEGGSEFQARLKERYNPGVRAGTATQS